MAGQQQAVIVGKQLVERGHIVRHGSIRRCNDRRCPGHHMKTKGRYRHKEETHNLPGHQISIGHSGFHQQCRASHQQPLPHAASSRQHTKRFQRNYLQFNQMLNHRQRYNQWPCNELMLESQKQGVVSIHRELDLNANHRHLFLSWSLPLPERPRHSFTLPFLRTKEFRSNNWIQ